MTLLSIVIPVRDEEENLPELYRRISKIADDIDDSCEIIFVTDNNRDRTLDMLKELRERDQRVKVLKLANSFGQYIAVMAGLHHASGEAVVTMDGDLQDHPEDIPRLIEKYREGFDVVYGVKDKKDDSVLRNILSDTFIKLLNKLSDTELDHNTCLFRIMSRRTVDALNRFPENEPSLTGLTSLIGFPTAKVQVTSGVRMAGDTKYDYFSLFNLAIGMLLSFSTKPLRLIAVIGLSVSLLSFLYLILVLIGSILGEVDVTGWPTIISLITFLGGVQLLSVGIIGEYIGKIFMETKKRPLYIVDEALGFRSTANSSQ